MNTSTSKPSPKQMHVSLVPATSYCVKDLELAPYWLPTMCFWLGLGFQDQIQASWSVQNNGRSVFPTPSHAEPLSSFLDFPRLNDGQRPSGLVHPASRSLRLYGPRVRIFFPPSSSKKTTCRPRHVARSDHGAALQYRGGCNGDVRKLLIGTWAPHRKKCRVVDGRKTLGAPTISSVEVGCGGCQGVSIYIPFEDVVGALGFNMLECRWKCAVALGLVKGLLELNMDRSPDHSALSLSLRSKS